MNYHRLHKHHDRIKKDLIGKAIRCHIEQLDTKNRQITISLAWSPLSVLHITDAFYELDSEGEYIELEIQFEGHLYECFLLDPHLIESLCNQ